MKKYSWFAISFLCLALMIPWGEAHADMAGPFGGRRPRPRPIPPRPVVVPESARMNIRRDDKADRCRLKIPRKLLLVANAADASDDKRPQTALTPASMVLPGLALSLALVSGGLWLARFRRPLSRPVAAVGLVAFALLALTGSSLWADIPPPWLRPVAPAPEKVEVAPVLPELLGSTEVRVQIVNAGDEIELILNRTAATQLARKLTPKEEAKSPK